jgi:hypothetical protein
METQVEMDAALVLLAAQAAEVEDEEVRAVVMQGVGAFLDAVTKAAAQHNAMIEEVARAHGLIIAPAMLLSVPQIVCARFFAAIVRLEVDRVGPDVPLCRSTSLLFTDADGEPCSAAFLRRSSTVSLSRRSFSCLTVFNTRKTGVR